MSYKIRLNAAIHPFKTDRKQLEFSEGITIKEMVNIAQPDAKQLEHALVFCKGQIIPRDMWHRYRPKAGSLIEMRAFPVPTGGGDSGKNILRIVAMIAIIIISVATGQLYGVALAGQLGITGTVGVAIVTSVITTVVATVGMLAVNALIPIRPPTLDALSGTSGTSDSPTLFVDGARNSLQPFGVVPSILGKFRSTPPLGTKPYTEVVGDKQFLRMLFVWGVGPMSIDISSLRIGDTPLANFQGVQIEHREGYVTDEPLTLFSNTIKQQDFSIALTLASPNWISRTSEVKADELSVDITFPQGLVMFDEQGNRNPRSVNLEINYRKVGDIPWLKPDTSNLKFFTTAAPEWLSKTGDSLDSITFTQNRTAAIRHGVKWGVSEQAQYEVRLRRTTADSVSSQTYDAMVWSSLRTITNTDPILAPVPLAKTALVIQATDQLNNIIDDFSGEVTTVAPDWDVDTETWIIRATQNPASLYRHVLQGNGMSSPLADNRIDLESLQDWHVFCAAKGFSFNMIRDFNASVWSTLADVAAAGRATPAQNDGKWSVTVDDIKEVPVSFITPRNSFDFKAEKFFIDPADGFRIRFPNEQMDYRFDERRVYRDGFNDDNSSKFELLELPGVTHPDHVYKLGRFRIAQGILQPERWSFKQDMEYLTYRRGDRVSITHDILLVGLKSGRIKGLILDGANVTGIQTDEEVIMEAGKGYGVVIRSLSDAKITRQVTGDIDVPTKTLYFQSPVLGVGSPPEQAIVIGDIFGFGLFGLETDDATIISITPDTNFIAQIVAVPYRAAIFTADTETIPPFDSRITPLLPIPVPQVRSIVSDETVMVVNSAGTVKIRVMVTYDPMNQSLFGIAPDVKIQMRRSGTGENFSDAAVDEKANGHFFISNVDTKEIIDLRFRFEIPNRMPGPWAIISSHQIIGKSTPPQPLRNMTISAYGAQALIRWDRPTELDVIFGGEVVFRHCASLDGATWGESVSIGQSAMARTLFTTLPLKEGTYLARVYDVDGNASTEITAVTTKQVSVHEFINLDSLDEAPSYLGSKDGVEESSGSLRLIEGSPTPLEGTYHFDNGFDLTTVKRVRLTTRIQSTIYLVGDTIDSRLGSIDTWEDFDGAIDAGADCRIFVRHTDDDPNGSPVNWTAWERLDSAEFEARGFELKAVLTRDNTDYNIEVSEMGVDVDVIS